ncbi:hypothetical protein WMF15_47580 [Sorangium sp. So ce233]
MDHESRDREAMAQIVGSQLPRVISVEPGADTGLTEGGAEVRGRQALTTQTEKEGEGGRARKGAVTL